MKKLMLLSLVFLFFSSSAVFGQIKTDPKHPINEQPFLNEPFVQPQEFLNFSFTDDHYFNYVPRTNNREIDSGLAQQLQSVLDEYVVDYQIKGLSGALMAPNGDIWAGASGISHDTIDLTTDMLLGIASNTKNFIATIIMQLYETDSLSLSDSLYKFVPSYENIDSNVTVKQLLNHTSGIYNYLNSPALGDSLNESTTRTWTVEELLDYFVLEPSFAPGENWEYSNTNYLLLGMIIEKVTGNEVVDEIRNRLSLPLGLSSTYLFPDEGYEGFRSHVWTMISGTLVDVTYFVDTALFSAAWTAGAMLSTATDMVKWSKGLNEGELLQDYTLELMRVPAPFSDGYYGLGTQIFPLYSKTIYGHTGDLIYYSMCFYVPDDSVSIMIMSNQRFAPINDMWLDLYFTYMEVLTTVIEIDDNIFVRVFPNPATSTANFGFELENKSRIKLSVHNQLGQLVSVLADEIKPAGNHLVKWDAIGFPAGLYTYRLEIGGDLKTGKLIILD